MEKDCENSEEKKTRFKTLVKTNNRLPVNSLGDNYCIYKYELFIKADNRLVSLSDALVVPEGHLCTLSLYFAHNLNLLIHYIRCHYMLNIDKIYVRCSFARTDLIPQRHFSVSHHTTALTSTGTMKYSWVRPKFVSTP